MRRVSDTDADKVTPTFYSFPSLSFVFQYVRLPGGERGGSTAPLSTSSQARRGQRRAPACDYVDNGASGTIGSVGPDPTKEVLGLCGGDKEKAACIIFCLTSFMSIKVFKCISFVFCILQHMRALCTYVRAWAKDFLVSRDSARSRSPQAHENLHVTVWYQHTGKSFFCSTGGNTWTHGSARPA